MNAVKVEEQKQAGYYIWYARSIGYHCSLVKSDPYEHTRIPISLNDTFSIIICFTFVYEFALNLVFGK